ncbi:MAG: hypothetical protein PQJ47_07165 [Sphaerochaetaceae bacterium]|nr:hypothetical protein [Sphaerochaetaceae bacterium]
MNNERSRFRVRDDHTSNLLDSGLYRRNGRARRNSTIGENLRVIGEK